MVLSQNIAKLREYNIAIIVRQAPVHGPGLRMIHIRLHQWELRTPDRDIAGKHSNVFRNVTWKVDFGNKE